jgi:hypothetical protein
MLAQIRLLPVSDGLTMKSEERLRESPLIEASLELTNLGLNDVVPTC